MTPLFYHPGPKPPSPEERLLLMNDVQWEAFIEESVRQLKTEGDYIQVIRMGGAGDKGRDVCGYIQKRPEADTWDLYQAKYYASALSPSQFGPELAKFIFFVFSNDYTVPRNYFICALKVGPSLHDLVLNPDRFSEWFIKQLAAGKGELAEYKTKLTPEIENFIVNFPFSIFSIKSAADLLEIHARSAKHWEQFGVLPRREANPEMPETPSSDEQNYVRELMLAYEEQCGIAVQNLESIPSSFNNHFKSQRRTFYSAEGLNRFSRDKLAGAFDELVNQVEVGISSNLTYPHVNGMARLKDVLDIANTLQVTSNPLHARLQAGDLQGTCHHLANQERLTWVDKNE